MLFIMFSFILGSRPLLVFFLGILRFFSTNLAVFWGFVEKFQRFRRSVVFFSGISEGFWHFSRDSSGCNVASRNSNSVFPGILDCFQGFRGFFLEFQACSRNATYRVHSQNPEEILISEKRQNLSKCPLSARPSVLQLFQKESIKYQQKTIPKRL